VWVTFSPIKGERQEVELEGYTSVDPNVLFFPPTISRRPGEDVQKYGQERGRMERYETRSIRTGATYSLTAGSIHEPFLPYQRLTHQQGRDRPSQDRHGLMLSYRGLNAIPACCWRLPRALLTFLQ
jgi:hypothetical protein